MKRRPGYTAMLLFLTILISSCSAQRKLEGTWVADTSSTTQQGALAQNSAFTFNHDGTVVLKEHITMGPLKMEDDSNGTYKVDGDHLTITMRSRTMALDPSTQRAVFSRLESMHPGSTVGMATQPPRTMAVHSPPEKLIWKLKDNDTLALQQVGSSTPATDFTRQDSSKAVIQQ